MIFIVVHATESQNAIFINFIYYIPINDRHFELHVSGHLMQNAIINKGPVVQN